jgi:hypothetical protein
MSDGDTIAAGGLDLGLDRTELRTFLALAAGHLLFAAGLFTIAPLIQDYGLYAITPLFGLPLLVFGPKDRLAVRALVLLAGITAVHYFAVYLANESVAIPFSGHPGFIDSPWAPGAIGGLVGATGSFALLALSGMLRPGGYATLGIAILALTVIGAVSVRYSVFGPHSGGDNGIVPLLWIYSPWQLAFAYFLAKLLKA